MRRHRRVALQAPFLALAILAGGCASGVATPPSTESSSAPRKAAEPVQPRPHTPPQGEEKSTAEAPEARRPKSETNPPETIEASKAVGAYGVKTVEIETHTEEPDAEPASLVEAARLAREKRASEGAPVAVITDETLSDYATGELSEGIARPLPPADNVEPGATAADGSAAPVAPGGSANPEEYWRNRVRTARLDWRDLEVEVTDLENRVAELRTKFYAEDDGFYRDSQIKPAWDRALDRLGEVRQKVSVAQEELAVIIQEGRSAGALPGWLREGVEYEPATPEVEDELDPHEALEPVVIDGDGGGVRR